MSNKGRRKNRPQEHKARGEGSARPPRQESEVLEELRELTRRPGFIHALAAIAFNSNVITAREEFTVEDFLKLYQPERLIRTETNLLTGLMLSADVDTSLPSPQVVQEYIDRALALLEELHQAIIEAGHDIFMAAMKELSTGNDDVANPLASGVMMREAIFYGGESAFPFQYEALAKQRYSPDREWLQDHMGFDIDEAAEVLSAVREAVNSNFPTHLDRMRKQSPLEWSWLPMFTFTIEDVLERTSLPAEKIQRILDAFSVYERDAALNLKTAGDYNRAATHPIIRTADHKMISLLDYGVYAALYENPFYWIAGDKEYFGIHSQSRGSFVERFTEEVLCRVFPNQYIYRNVVFKNKSGQAVGEADVILVYGYRAFIIQAKSKRLTLASWQGDDVAIAKDFQAAVQEAYDQAIDCVRHIKNGVDAYAGGKLIDLKKHGKIREFYPICITSEHYPSLSFQSGVLLKTKEEPNVLHPIITDVFTLDVMAEMLETPMYFTDYLIKRAAAADRLHVSHELVALAFYIKRNLHVNEGEFFTIADDFMVELDLAMAVRRMGIEGQATPEGQLTRFGGTPLGKTLDYVNKSDRPDIHRLGEVILAMDGEAADELNTNIGKIVGLTVRDGGRHDVTIHLAGGGGITIHCNKDSLDRARNILARHCEMRKYVQKSDRWYGVTIDVDGDPVFLMGFEYPWSFDEKLEAEAAPYRLRTVTHALGSKRKFGRNEQCPCGSGKKYKKCCLQ